jgi:hypothetical protein
MWRIFHLLFGWDYVAWANSAHQGIARVHVDGMGRAYYWRYKAIRVADFIEKPECVIWLTCGPEKYMPTQADRPSGKPAGPPLEPLEKTIKPLS